MTIERPKIEKFSDLTEEMIFERSLEFKVKITQPWPPYKTVEECDAQVLENMKINARQLLEMSALLQPHFVTWWNTNTVAGDIEIANLSLSEKAQNTDPILAFRDFDLLIKNPEKHIPIAKEARALDL